MYSGAFELGPYEHECPVCGLRDQYSDCTTVTILTRMRRTSKNEIRAYQMRYGNLIKHVDHYRS